MTRRHMADEDEAAIANFGCPYCGAPKGEACRAITVAGTRLETTPRPHLSRRRKFRESKIFRATLREDPSEVSPLEVGCPTCGVRQIASCVVIRDAVAMYTVTWFHQTRVHLAETGTDDVTLFPLAA